MAEEYIYQREQDLLDYFRNNITDPESRGSVRTETFTATASQTAFVLASVLVKNVATTITVDAVDKRKGHDFTVSYGEGKKVTTVTLGTGAGVGEAVVIEYTYGPSMIEREYSRSDAKLPRIIMMFLSGSEEFAGIGDTMLDGKGSYFNGSYVFEIRARYASQARQLASQAFNLGRKMRQDNIFRTYITQVSDLQNFDYDREKDAYIWQFTLDIQWDILFE